MSRPSCSPQRLQRRGFRLARGNFAASPTPSIRRPQSAAVTHLLRGHTHHDPYRRGKAATSPRLRVSVISRACSIPSSSIPAVCESCSNGRRRSRSTRGWPALFATSAPLRLSAPAAPHLAQLKAACALPPNSDRFTVPFACLRTSAGWQVIPRRTTAQSGSERMTWPRGSRAASGVLANLHPKPRR
jgi:hypothetical protein